MAPWDSFAGASSTLPGLEFPCQMESQQSQLLTAPRREWPVGQRGSLVKDTVGVPAGLHFGIVLSVDMSRTTV